jgi:acetyl-CoA C-acetyltransferase
VTLLERDETVRGATTLESLAALKPLVRARWARSTASTAVALLRYPEVERIEHVHHAGNSSGIVDGAAAVLIGSAAVGAQGRTRSRGRASARSPRSAPSPPSCSPVRRRQRSAR